MRLTLSVYGPLPGRAARTATRYSPVTGATATTRWLSASCADDASRREAALPFVVSSDDVFASQTDSSVCTASGPLSAATSAWPACSFTR